MRIAVVHNLPAGGMKRVLYELVLRLSEKHQIDIYTFTSSKDQQFPLKKTTTNYYSIDYSYPEHFPASVLSVYTKLKKAYFQMAEKVNSGGYDLAFVFPCFLTQAPFILRFLKVPSLYFFSESKREFYEDIPRVSNRLTYTATRPFRLPIKKIDYENTRLADKIVTFSKYNQEILKDIYGQKSLLVSLGVNGKVFHPIKTVKKNFVLSVGNFTLLKGHDFLISSLALLSEKNRPELVIAGFKGIDQPYLEALARKKNVKLNFLDNPTDETLNRLYNQARLFLFAGRSEPFGLVILEALACGLKVVAVGEGGVPEIINDKRLGILTKRNEKEFADALKKELKKNQNLTSNKIRREIVLNKWNWEKTAVHLEEIFKKFK